MKKQILTYNETKTFLMKAIGCTRQAVWQALNFERNSEQARRIRTLALKRGGKLTDGFVPECETTYQEAERTITLDFGPRVKIIYDRETDEAVVYVDGQQKSSYTGLSVPDFLQLEHEVQQMASAL